MIHRSFYVHIIGKEENNNIVKHRAFINPPFLFVSMRSGRQSGKFKSLSANKENRCICEGEKKWRPWPLSDIWKV